MPKPNRFRRPVFFMLVVGTLLLRERTDAGEWTVQSPDGRIRATASLREGHIQMRADVAGRPLLADTPLGLLFPASVTWRVTGQTLRNIDETWTPVLYKRSRVRNACSELSLRTIAEGGDGFRQPVTIRIRAYNDGLAVRYVLEKSGDDSSRVAITGEATRFVFARDTPWWGYRIEHEPRGPKKLSKMAGPFDYPLVSVMDDHLAVALVEACVRDYPFARFRSRPGQPALGIQPFAKPLTLTLPFALPWRVLLVAQTPGGLIDSDVIVNLNPKADPNAFSWVKGGIALWDWRAWGYTADDGFTYGLNLPSWKRHIDFAAEQGIPFLVIDANWYGKEFNKQSNPFTGGKAPDVKKAIEYGKKKGVGLILYLNDVAGRNYGIEKILKAYSDWGAVGIKYGFMRRNDRLAKVKWTHHIVKECAKNHLLVNFHDGPIPPTGEEATWPNFSTREFIHAQSDAHRAFTPGTFIHMMHVNTIAGPVDDNNGLFDLDDPTGRPRIFRIVPSTIVSEAARTLIPYSGLVVIPDAPDAYRKHPDLFRFIALQKQPWTDSRVLSSDFDHWISVMRRNNDLYLVGTVTDEHARELPIRLDFLPKNRKFLATIFSDAPDADFKTNRTAYRSETRTVTAADTIRAKMARGGGHCIILEPLKE